MGRWSYCPSHPWNFKNSGNTVDSPDHRMEVCLMSGLGATVQAEVRLLRFSQHGWGAQHMTTTSLLCLSCCVLLCSRPHSPSGSLSHPLHCFVSRQGKDTHFHLSPRKTDPEGELPSLIRETQAAGWDGAMFQWANAPV